jgi:acetyl-CoA synthetase
VPGYAVRLVDPEGVEVSGAGEGVMHVRGLSNAQYYWNRPDKTAETMLDGWINTGDRFVRDDGGRYFFKGRADDLVKVSGQWVWPMEVELALNEHADVVESCVLAVPMADGRTTLCAWVAAKPGVAADDTLRSALVDHAKSALLPHKYPRHIHFLDTLPKTGTDKIDRQALRATWNS